MQLLRHPRMSQVVCWDNTQNKRFAFKKTNLVREADCSTCSKEIDKCNFLVKKIEKRPKMV